MLRAIVAVALVFCVPHSGAQTAVAPAQSQGAAVFAIVGDTVIGTAEYDAALAAAHRQRFYHRQAPESQVQALRREVGDQLIERVLLEAETRRRGITADRAQVDELIAGYETRYRSSPQWPRIQAEMLPGLKRELERRNVVERFESQVREAPEPTESQLKSFYDRHRDRFVEPERFKLSLILLKVDPSSARAIWDKAHEEAAVIRDRLVRGGDFAEAAKLRSGDASAERGGDMGYLHRGMLPDGLAEQLDKVTLGTISEPLKMLEGVALIRIDDRKPAQTRSLIEVRDRAVQLWRREEGDRRWQALIADLRRQTQVKVVDASRYPARQNNN